MKKIVKGLMIFSVGILLAGCSCSNNSNDNETKIDYDYTINRVYDDIKNSYSELYATAVKSTVRVIAKNSLGSGVVYKEEGNYAYILTNAHVLTDVSNTDNYSSIEIVFSNYVRVKGTYIYLDKNEDVAVISVPKSDNYTVAKIVSSDTDTKVGEEVLAIGNPSGIYFSASYGKISATKIKTTTDYISGTSATTTYVYNSDATLNGGNSGGPLFNSNGEVIAINTMRPTDETNTRDFNYSIPINHFIKVADYIVSNRTSYSRAYLNIEGKSICDYSTSEIATLGITVKTGVYVTSSSETEVSRGRIITQVNGASVATLSDYEYELLKYSKNETITLTTVDISGNNSRTINLRLR